MESAKLREEEVQSILIDVKEFENQDKAHEDSLASWELALALTFLIPAISKIV